MWRKKTHKTNKGPYPHSHRKTNIGEFQLLKCRSLSLDAAAGLELLQVRCLMWPAFGGHHPLPVWASYCSVWASEGKAKPQRVPAGSVQGAEGSQCGAEWSRSAAEPRPAQAVWEPRSPPRCVPAGARGRGVLLRAQLHANAERASRLQLPFGQLGDQENQLPNTMVRRHPLSSCCPAILSVEPHKILNCCCINQE